MGLIKAGIGAVGSTLADQWKEFFYCDALTKEVLVTKGQKRISGRSSNTKGSDNIISNGSGIAVADGQCMMIVEQGKIVEVCAEPGEFTYDTSSEPSVFSGNLGESVMQTFKTVGKRFAFGGDTGKDQRVYYFNTKEILDNKFGTPNPFMFDVVNKEIGMRRTVQVRCNGVYSYKITDPLLFYTQVCGNVEREYTRDEIDSQLKTEFIDGLQPAFAALSELALRPAQIPAHTKELKDAMNEALKSTWTEQRGIQVQSIALNPITLTEEDMKKINQMEDAATMGSNPFMMAGRMADSTANAMEAAAANDGGALNGFLGMGMAMNAGGGAGGFGAAQNFYTAGVQQQQVMQQQAAQQQAAQQANVGWKCSCGATATGKFCPECGSPKPVENGWQCSCGAMNKGKFCQNCGAKKPSGVPLYKCDKCGWEPEDPKNPPKFCPECGDPFDMNDIQ
ncbi:MAG: SPFH domain-containing protein [Lachnospiraceae bacterium]|jgi:membrane protease subunit (stomatin/prohibitin family)